MIQQQVHKAHQGYLGHAKKMQRIQFSIYLANKRTKQLREQFKKDLTENYKEIRRLEKLLQEEKDNPLTQI